MIHHSGHETRLNRITSTSFGSIEYAKEELVAEFGAAILSAHFGLTYETNHAAYIKGWLTDLKDDKQAIYNAITKAQKAVDYILKTTEEKKEVA
jgi:antirestriction protein ArdC